MERQEFQHELEGLQRLYKFKEGLGEGMKRYLLVFLVFTQALSAGDSSSPLVRRRANSQPKSGPSSPLTERARIEARIAKFEAAQREHIQRLTEVEELLHGGRHEVKESKPVPGKAVHQRRTKGSKEPWEECTPHVHHPHYDYRIIPATEEVTTIVTYLPVRQQLRDHGARITALERATHQQRTEQQPDNQRSFLPSIQSQSKSKDRAVQQRWQSAACAVQGQRLSLMQRYGPGPG